MMVIQGEYFYIHYLHVNIKIISTFMTQKVVTLNYYVMLYF
jgi:hypothetical protein